MIEVLIADDNACKVSELTELLVSCGVQKSFISVARSVNGAKEKLSSQHFDLLLLDIQMPIRDDGKKLKNAGIFLLRKLVHSDGENFFTPANIIGITAFDDIYKDSRAEFKEHGAYSIIKYSVTESGWKEILSKRIPLILRSKCCSGSSDRDKAHIVLTVHGIRTFGAWQDRIKNIIKRYDSSIDVHNFSYGYYSLISYLFPPFRLILLRKFKYDLCSVFSKYSDCKIDIVCHSFGTYLVANALKSFIGSNVKISSVILSGSVLATGFEWNKLLDCKVVTRVVNDCGVNDTILLFNRVFILFSGMAGRIGFEGFSSDRFYNRFFVGSHRLYFTENGLESNSFMEKYWVPLIVSDADPLPGNNVPAYGVLSSLKCSLIGKLWVFNILFYSIIFYLGLSFLYASN